MFIFFQVILNGMLAAAIYALTAAGLSFLYSTTKIFHLAHGVSVLAAGYAFWFFWTLLHWHPVFAGLAALATASLIGFLMNELVYETLRRRGTRGLGYLIAALALLMLGTAALLALFGAAPKTFSVSSSRLAWRDIGLTELQWWSMALSIFLLGGFYWLVKKTRFGKAMRATADQEEVAQVLGINTRRIRALAFVAAGPLAAAAGIVNGLEFNLDPNQAVLIVIKGFAAAVIGGAGSFSGAIAGSLIVGVLEQAVVWFLGAGWRNAVTFTLLFLILLFRPTGLFGHRRGV